MLKSLKWGLFLYCRISFVFKLQFIIIWIIYLKKYIDFFCQLFIHKYLFQLQLLRQRLWKQQQWRHLPAPNQHASHARPHPHIHLRRGPTDQVRPARHR